MVANIGPADWNFDETMSTLRYANRAKNIQNKPRINEDPKDAMLREFQVQFCVAMKLLIIRIQSIRCCQIMGKTVQKQTTKDKLFCCGFIFCTGFVLMQII
jgi:hypothetical protein